MPIRRVISLILAVLLVWCIVPVKRGYCLDLEKMKVCFLKGDYKGAIVEGEKIVASSRHSPDEDELYYILALSYLKDENYLRASDIFEIVIKEFKNSGYRGEAKMGLGDTYFLRGDFEKAQNYYQELLRDEPSSELKAELYYRLSQAWFKKGDGQQGNQYLDKLKTEFALNPNLKLNKDLYGALDAAAGYYYAVQVGSFAGRINAQNLTQKLIQQGYSAYIEEVTAAPAPIYKVRAGKFKTLQEAQDAEKKLAESGYPTKICP